MTALAVIAAGVLALTAPGPQWAGAAIALVTGLTLIGLVDRADGSLYAGVIACLAAPRHRALLRAAVIVTAPLAGAGIAAYTAAAFSLALRPRRERQRPAGWPAAAGVGLAGLAVVVAADAAGVAVMDPILWGVLLVGSGLSLFWAAGGGDVEFALDDDWLNTLVGVLLVLVGLAVVLDATNAFGLDAATVVGALAVLAVAACVFVPRALGAKRRLGAETRRREREEERAEIGEMLHDSVLQTLALIQRRDDAPAPIVALARRQERELRDWLLRGETAGRRAHTFDDRLRSIVAAIEDDHDARIETVIVGDAPLSPAVDALLAATREALLNAVKHGEGAPVTLFAKVRDAALTVFVRDRGPGFDMTAIDAARRGIRSSILERIERAGGRAEITSTPGQGCEVVLKVAL